MPVWYVFCLFLIQRYQSSVLYVFSIFIILTLGGRLQLYIRLFCSHEAAIADSHLISPASFKPKQHSGLVSHALTCLRHHTVQQSNLSAHSILKTSIKSVTYLSNIAYPEKGAQEAITLPVAPQIISAKNFRTSINLAGGSGPLCFIVSGRNIICAACFPAI